MKKDQWKKRMFLFVCLLVLASLIDVIFRNIRSVSFLVFVVVAMASVFSFLFLDEAYSGYANKERKAGLLMIIIGVLVFMYTGWLSLATFQTLAGASGAPLTFFGLMLYIGSFRSKWS